MLALAEIAGAIDRRARDQWTRLLEELGMTAHRHRLPGELSGGEKQRVAIGRALMNDPSLVLANEPSSNLDSERGRRVVKLLADEIRSRNKLGIMVTHDQRMLDYVDRVLENADGRYPSLRRWLRLMPGLRDSLTNLRADMPLVSKLRAIAANNWKKLRTRSRCCGNGGQPGC